MDPLTCAFSKGREYPGQKYLSYRLVLYFCL